MVILLAPIIIIIFIAGWSLYWAGRPKQPKTKQPQKAINKTVEQDNVDLFVMPSQEEILAD